jgi:hypothetical protein
MHFLFTMSKIWQTHRSVCKLFAGQAVGSSASSMMRRWWSQTGSNRRPHACKARALPTELWPRRRTEDEHQTTEMNSVICPPSSVVRLPSLVGLGRLELPTSRLSSARSNQLSYKPELMTPPGADSKVPKARAGLSGKKEKRRRRQSRVIGLTGHCSSEIR